MRKSLASLSGALVVALALSGCDRAGASSKAGELTPARRVVAQKPVRQDVARVIEQPATVRALNEATVYAQVAGYLATITVDKGDTVKKGDVIATIEVPELDAERQEIVAATAQAEAELVASKVELERADSALLAAQAGLKRADADLALKKSLYDRA